MMWNKVGKEKTELFPKKLINDDTLCFFLSLISFMTIILVYIGIMGIYGNKDKYPLDYIMLSTNSTNDSYKIIEYHS